MLTLGTVFLSLSAAHPEARLVGMWWTQCECAEQEPEAAPGHVYMNHIYFTYISLWEGLSSVAYSIWVHRPR
jgi:hypothetical protein